MRAWERTALTSDYLQLLNHTVGPLNKNDHAHSDSCDEIENGAIETKNVFN